MNIRTLGFFCIYLLFLSGFRGVAQNTSDSASDSNLSFSNLNKNHLSVGTHFLNSPSHLDNLFLELYPILQLSYKRNFSSFNIRAGFFYGLKYFTRGSPYLKHGRKLAFTSDYAIAFNLGVEKTLFYDTNNIQINFGLDYHHLNRWQKYIHPPFNDGKKVVDAIGVSLINHYFFNSYNGISFEIGFAYGKSGWSKIHGIKWDERRFSFIRRYRGFVLSYFQKF